jgi:hypothetical protein
MGFKRKVSGILWDRGGGAAAAAGAGVGTGQREVGVEG